MNVLVNGVGNIGSTLIALLARFHSELELSTIYALKNTPKPWHAEDLEYFSSLGITICTRNKDDQFAFLDDIIDTIDYIFDCTANGGGLKNKSWYIDLPQLKGASAQGSEKDFGTSFMSGVNNEAILSKKFVHIVSCNTHSLASLLTTFTGENLEDLSEDDFVVVRRSEDIGNHQRLVSANVVARHLDDQLGTHHSIDLQHLFETKGILVQVTSSDITTPSQLMHGVRFNICFKEKRTAYELEKLINANPLVSTSVKFDSNVIFERGRRIGFQGRIYSHAVIISNNLLITPTSVKGWAFIPQEGNTILSTLHAFLLQVNHAKTSELMSTFRHQLIRKTW